METKRNFQRELDEIIKNIPQGTVPTLLLHSCCAPCSSYCLEYLTQYFDITIFFYNPNITDEQEYNYRVNELKRLISQVNYRNPVKLIEGKYEPELFFEMARGMEELPEKGRRCYECYKLRMTEAAVLAKKLNSDYFTTTLSISPMKNAAWINDIGEILASEYDITHLPSDFKKKNGYKRSIELSEEYDLYRQNYCGCVYSKR